MSHDLYAITALGLLDGQQRLETISRNAANASVPGYRRQVAASRSFAADLEKVDAGVTPAPVAPQARVDLRAGAIALSGRPLDLAIEGGGAYFALSDGTTTWLTRAGSFQVNDDGYLVGERGLKVQGTAGDLRVDGPDVEVTADGRLLRAGVAIGALQLFSPADAAALTSAGGTLLSAATGVVQAATGAARIRQGALEGSNAGGAADMVELLTLTRQYESLVRVTQGYDDLLGRTIQKLGEV
jgi:flagellar basal body rod protein FlgG